MPAASLSRDIWLSYPITSHCHRGTSAIRTAEAAIPPSAGASGAGFRCNLTGDGVWQGEAAVGFGGYYLDYDRFENTGPQGRLVDSKKRGFFGADHFTVSIVYSFSTHKR